MAFPTSNPGSSPAPAWKDPGECWSRVSQNLEDRNCHKAGRGGNISIVARGKYSSRKFSLIEISVTMYESSNLECFLFLHCLHFAVVNSDYSFVILKPKQVLCLAAYQMWKIFVAWNRLSQNVLS